LTIVTVLLSIWVYGCLCYMLTYIPLDKCPRVVLPDHMVVRCLVSWGNFTLISIMAATLGTRVYLYSHQQCIRVPFLCILASIFWFFLMIAIVTRVR
jgi:hypothetical protein